MWAYQKSPHPRPHHGEADLSSNLWDVRTTTDSSSKEAIQEAFSDDTNSVQG